MPREIIVLPARRNRRPVERFIAGPTDSISRRREDSVKRGPDPEFLDLLQRARNPPLFPTLLLLVTTVFLF